MNLAIGNMCKNWQVSIVVQEQMELHRSFALTELRPVKQACTEFDDGGVHAEELILESKLPFAKVQLLALAQ